MVRKIFLSAIVICLVFACVLSYKMQNKKTYIFINETTEHRFDESIRISIMAAMKRTGVQNAVVITNNVSEEDLEKKAAEMFSILRVGEKQKGRGILYLLSPKSKLLKIEIGYGLEGLLPDITTQSLELAAKSFIYTNRYQDFWAELINTLNLEIYEKEQGQEDGELKPFEFSKFKFLSGGAGVASRSYEPTLEQLKHEFRLKQQSFEYAATSTPQETLRNYLKSLEDGVGDSRLELLSFESQIFREFTPMTTYQLFRNGRMYKKAELDKVFEVRNLAFIFFKNGYPVLPIVMKKEDGKWKIQEALSWSLFHRFEDSMKVFLKFSLEKISPEFDDYLIKSFGEPLYPGGEALSIASINSESLNLSDPKTLYFNFYWLSQFEKETAQIKFKEATLNQIWMAADASLNLGQMTQFSKFYEMAASRLKNRSDMTKNAIFYRKLTEFNNSDWVLNF
jgi:hypothetical protein